MAAELSDWAQTICWSDLHPPGTCSAMQDLEAQNTTCHTDIDTVTICTAALNQSFKGSEFQSEVAISFASCSTGCQICWGACTCTSIPSCNCPTCTTCIVAYVICRAPPFQEVAGAVWGELGLPLTLCHSGTEQARKMRELSCYNLQDLELGNDHCKKTKQAARIS